MKRKPTFQVAVFRASAEEWTCAVIRCRTTDAVHDGNSLYSALSKALTAWFRESAEGQAAYRASSGDYNVGDLAGDITTKSLRSFLKGEDIHQLEIEIYTGEASGWEYDDRLFNGSVLEDQPPSTASPFS